MTQPDRCGVIVDTVERRECRKLLHDQTRVVEIDAQRAAALDLFPDDRPTVSELSDEDYEMEERAA